MNSNRKNSLVGRLLVLAALFATSAQLFAGYVYELESTGETADASGDSRILVDGAKLKMEMQGNQGGEMIYVGDSRQLLMIDHERKSYTIMGEEEISQLTNQMSDAMAQMEAQFANMPPAQREMMEKMMKGRMPQIAEKLEISVVRTGKKDTVEGYKTEMVELRVGNGDRRELWVSDWSNLKGGEDVSAAMKGMAGLFEDLMSIMSQGPMAGAFQSKQNGWFGQLDEMGGFPVKATEFDGSGNITSETVLKNIEETTIDAATFRAPKGYKKRKMGK